MGRLLALESGPLLLAGQATTAHARGHDGILQVSLPLPARCCWLRSMGDGASVQVVHGWGRGVCTEAVVIVCER